MSPTAERRLRQQKRRASEAKRALQCLERADAASVAMVAALSEHLSAVEDIRATFAERQVPGPLDMGETRRGLSRLVSSALASLANGGSRFGELELKPRAFDKPGTPWRQAETRFFQSFIQEANSQ